jgi:hypothetical protein
VPDRRAPRLLAARGLRTVFAGSASERALIEAIRSPSRDSSISLAGDLDVEELAPEEAEDEEAEPVAPVGEVEQLVRETLIDRFVDKLNQASAL